MCAPTWLSLRSADDARMEARLGLRVVSEVLESEILESKRSMFALVSFVDVCLNVSS